MNVSVLQHLLCIINMQLLQSIIFTLLHVQLCEDRDVI